ncbi:MAG: radical SAM protein [Promethearchaeota archaeon]
MNNKIQELLIKFRDGNASWSDYKEYLKLKDESYPLFFKLAKQMTINNFGQKLKIYIPNKKFPAISVTGSQCALHCEHCNEKYLDGMKHLQTNKALEEFLLNHHKKGGIGLLLSGGCEPDGSVPLLGFLDTIKKIKNQTNLIINTHTGLLNELTAEKLADAGVDIVSFDINIDKDIIQNIYHLDKTINDYKTAVEILKKHKLNIVPHICIGLYYGKLHKELESLQFIKDSGINPNLIVLIALIPPKEKKDLFKKPHPLDIAKIVALVRFIFPNIEISLGCMRPRGDIKVEVEKLAICAGINRIEIPSPRTIKWVKKNNPNTLFEYYSACCAIPEIFEPDAKSQENEIKRYENI